MQTTASPVPSCCCCCCCFHFWPWIVDQVNLGHKSAKCFPLGWTLILPLYLPIACDALVRNYTGKNSRVNYLIYQYLSFLSQRKSLIMLILYNLYSIINISLIISLLPELHWKNSRVHYLIYEYLTFLRQRKSRIMLILYNYIYYYKYIINYIFLSLRTYFQNCTGKIVS